MNDSSIENNEKENYEQLVTRANSYVKKVDIKEHQQSTPVRESTRGKTFFICKEHFEESKKWIWNKDFNSCKSCIKYDIRTEFPNRVLPTKGEVLEYLITLRNANNGKHVNNIYECAVTLTLHWIYCNVYPIAIASTIKAINAIDQAFKAIKKSASKSKIPSTHWNRYTKFLKDQNSLLDIRATPERTKVQEKLWGVKMKDRDIKFYELQKQIPRVGYSSDFVDRRWQLSKQRQERRENRSRNESYDNASFTNQVSFEDHEMDDLDCTKIDCEGDNDSVFDAPPLKRQKYSYHIEQDEKSDELPHKYRHPRCGLRKVRPELYALMHYLSASLHMSHEQVEGSIVAVANSLFGRKWKVYAGDSNGTDNNTLPSTSSCRRTEAYMEAMALSCVVDEIMKDGSKTCVVYSNDGSSQSVTGSYVVQSLTVNGVQRSLPTFGIFTETRESLKDLTLATLDVLSASTGYRFSSSQLLEKISFVMTDSTSHNVGVIDMVCSDLNVEKVPPQLFCNVHPLMLFQNKIKDVCQRIHDNLGKQRIKDCFLVDVDFQNESFVVKALKCLSNFINRDYSGKPWNRCQHFSDFIKPKENMSVSLKDHRFNRSNDCALSVLHHVNDITSYLEMFSTITNGVAILDRGFMDLEILKPIFIAIALLGLHITRPFHSLLMSDDTVYSTLLEAFPKLHHELTTIDPEKLLTINEQVFHFVPEEIFTESKPKPILLESLEEGYTQYSEEVTVLLKIMLKSFADGFAHQKGAIFGFGETADKPTEKNVAKICTMTKDEIDTLDKNVQTHNIGEERNVGMVNYELSIRGKGNLDSVSRKLVLNRSADLLKENCNSFKNYRKAAADIKKIRVEWNEKMKELEQKGFDAKEALNLKKDASKLKDLEFLKNQDIPGPFSSAEEVDKYLESPKSDKAKQDRLYKEVRYAKATCLSMNTKSLNQFFKLRQKGKKLEFQAYSVCLKKYFDTSKSVKTVSLPEFKNALGELCDEICNEPDITLNQETANQKQVGQHVIVFWVENNKRVWYLGIIDKITDDGIFVSHFAKTRSKFEWTFQEDSDIQLVEEDQIIKQGFAVCYLQSTRIRCKLEPDLVSEIENELKHC